MEFDQEIQESGSAELTHAPPYEHALEHLLDEFLRLDYKLRLILQLHPSQTEGNEWLGLATSKQEILRLLPIHHEQEQHSAQTDDLSQVESEIEQLQLLNHWIASRLEATIEAGIFLPFLHISKVFGWNGFEEQCVVIALAYEWNRKYERIFGYLQDDLTQSFPTIDVYLRILCQNPAERAEGLTYLSAQNKLRQTTLFIQEDPSQKSQLGQVLRIKPRMMRAIVEGLEVASELLSFSTYWKQDEPIQKLKADLARLEQMDQFLKQQVVFATQKSKPILFFFHGPSGSGKSLMTRHLVHRFEQNVLEIDLALLMQSKRDFASSLADGYRETLMLQAVISFSHVEVLYDDRNVVQRNEFIHALNRYDGIVFLHGTKPWPNHSDREHKWWIDVAFAIPDEQARAQIWSELISKTNVSRDVDAGHLASMFKLTRGQMERTMELATQDAQWQGSAYGAVQKRQIIQAAYQQIDHQLSRKASKISARAHWDDVVLPADQKQQLRNACNQISYRHVVYGQWGFDQKLAYGKGASMLFAGPPGTGKTWSAQVVATELGLDLYKIDLSQIISKYIGETEKNLSEIFHEAQHSHAILFFDETDALFGKRSEVKDSHDKYANIEVAYLLQKMEEYDGITVLATNYLQNIDEAFLRRINYVIRFPFPEVAEREAIWRRMFPAQTPLAKDVDFAYLARTFQIAGGNIKNVVLMACFLAAEQQTSVGMSHLIQAVRYEFNKSGKIVLPEDLGEYAHFLWQADGKR